jgi:hypothetical protein
MAKRQVIEIDVTFTDNWSELTTKEILELLVKKSVKNLTIKNIRKRKEAK